jgi:hypothetical protein
MLSGGSSRLGEQGSACKDRNDGPRAKRFEHVARTAEMSLMRIECISFQRCVSVAQRRRCSQFILEKPVGFRGLSEQIK